MNFEYSSEHLLLQQSIGNLFTKKYPVEYAREFISSNYQLEAALSSTLAEQGALSVFIENQEKITEGLVYSLLTILEAGKVLLPFPLVESHVVSFLLNKYCGESEMNEQQLMGEKNFTIGWTLDKNFSVEGNVLSGIVKYVPFAAQCDYALIHLPSKSVLIDLNKVEKHQLDSMDQTYPVYDIMLSNYEVDAEHVVANKNLDKEANKIAALLASAEMIGASQVVLKMTVDYVNERQQFNQVIGKFQAVKHKVADMYVLLESSRVTLKYAACVYAMNDEAEMGKTTHLLKSYVSDAANELMGYAIQLHGGIGFTWESDLHLFYKRARRLSAMYGDAYAHRSNLFKNLLAETNPSKISEVMING